MDGDNIKSLYPHADEPTEYLNIKRGILSALQLDVAATKETDVNGVCDVVVAKENGQVVKTKDLSKCEKRGVNEIGKISSSNAFFSERVFTGREFTHKIPSIQTKVYNLI